MLAETGQICLILAVLTSALQAGCGFWGAHNINPRWMKVSERSALANVWLCLIAFACLVGAFVTSDFSLSLVYLHSHTAKPMLYKFSGTWGNHEGSMLLWVMLIALFGSLIVVFGRRLPSGLRVRAIAVQGLIGLGFGAFLLFTSNPFSRLLPIPENGKGLNPVLQDPGLAFHPPFLYLGYVGFSVAFSLAVAALIEGRVDSVWARWLRPWVLLAWSFLTIGITLGSVWAYYELGWGGWWYWDPVENVSFMPWLAATALLHSILVVQARRSFIRWTLLLAIVTFSLSLIGTFIVRSGVLTSIHSFAVDPSRGIFLLLLLVLAAGGAFLLYYLRSDQIDHGAGHEVISRESALVLNNLLLVVSIVTVFLGTFYPLIMDALTGDKITVGPPYYNIVFAPIMLLLIVTMAVGPLLKWGKDNLARLRSYLIVMASVSVSLFIVVAIFGKTILGGIGFGVAIWLALGTLITYGQKLKIGRAKSSWQNLFTRFRIQPAITHGFVLAHLGIAISTAGISAMGAWADHEQERLKIGETVSVGGFNFTVSNAETRRGANFFATAITLTISDQNGNSLKPLIVENRQYPIEGTATAEGSLNITPFRTLYATVGEGDRERGWVIETYYHPLVSWIWGGALLMAFGGFVSMADNRMRLSVRNPVGEDPMPAQVQ